MTCYHLIENIFQKVTFFHVHKSCVSKFATRITARGPNNSSETLFRGHLKFRLGPGGAFRHNPPNARSRCRAGIYAPTYFFPDLVEQIPPQEGAAPAAARQARRKRHDGVAQRPCAIIAPGEVRLIRSGIPLSLMWAAYDLCGLHIELAEELATYFAE